MNQKTVAAFDFDGTLSYRDTFVPFLLSSQAKVEVLKKIIGLIPTALGFTIGVLEREKSKERFLTDFFSGMSYLELEDYAKKFARDYLPRQIKPEGLSRLKWHQEQGHYCVLISASLDIYLEPWAKSVGFDQVLASTLECEDHKITGKLLGGNCRGQEKVNRLIAKVGPLSEYTLYAYGDSSGDKELLEAADHAYYRKMGE